MEFWSTSEAWKDRYQSPNLSLRYTIHTILFTEDLAMTFKYIYLPLLLMDLNGLSRQQLEVTMEV